MARVRQDRWLDDFRLYGLAGDYIGNVADPGNPTTTFENGDLVRLSGLQGLLEARGSIMQLYVSGMIWEEIDEAAVRSWPKRASSLLRRSKLEHAVMPVSTDTLYVLDHSKAIFGSTTLLLSC